jgi:deoxyribodipyrimidine photo-lyase
LFEPGSVLNGNGRPFQVFTAFWRACLAAKAPADPLSAPRHLSSPAVWPKSLRLDDLRLEPKIDWAGGIRETWQPGERGAAKRLTRFLKGPIDSYPTGRDRPDLPGTSQLSPYLHFGEISARQVWRQVRRSSASSAAAETYIRQIGWREFSYHMLVHFPDTPRNPLRPEFGAFPWHIDKKLLKAWTRGYTGYPLVDAGMRQLWRVGWMHNRVRMIAASFLVKDLMIPWQEGAAWFWDTLVDADLANNTMGWQWTAGCGADAAPFFRVFNPVTQAEKFDPDERYVRRWIPELGSTEYPRPVVDHDVARRRALAASKRLRSPRK